MAAENGASGGCFRDPFHQRPSRAPGRFNLFLGYSRQASKASSLPPRELLLTFFDVLFSLPPPLPFLFRGSYFGSSSSVPKIVFSRPTLRVMARGIYGTPSPTSLRPCLPRRPPSRISSFNFLLSQTRTLSHERTNIIIPPCLCSSTLDRSRVPRGDISETG
jgi:hypothetical protein